MSLLELPLAQMNRATYPFSMPRFAANLTMLFTEVPFLERFAAARGAGFSAIEYLFPYDHDAGEIRKALDEAGLSQVLFNAPPGDWAAGERGLAAMPGNEILFRQSLDEALHYAAILRPEKLHVMAGIVPKGISQQECTACYVSNMKWAAAEAAKQGLTLTIEPLNPYDVPGYLLSSVDQAASIIAKTGASNIAIQYDLYHQSRYGGELIGTYMRHADLIGHMQVAGNPGRHEPGTGEIDYGFVFSELDRLGYSGWIGCEYLPAGRTEDRLGWVRPWLEAQ